MRSHLLSLVAAHGDLVMRLAGDRSKLTDSPTTPSPKFVHNFRSLKDTYAYLGLILDFGFTAYHENPRSFPCGAHHDLAM